VLDGSIAHGRSIRRDLEGSGHDPIKILPQYFPRGTTENNNKPSEFLSFWTFSIIQYSRN
jgi:hypothetical protein